MSEKEKFYRLLRYLIYFGVAFVIGSLGCAFYAIHYANY